MFCFVVILICVDDTLLRRFMLQAYEMGMTSGEYVFITPNLLPNPDYKNLWFLQGATDNDKARTAYQPLIQVRPTMFRFGKN